MSIGVVHIVQTVDGGGVAQAAALALHAAKRGADVTVTAPAPGIRTPRGVRVVVLPTSPLRRSARITTVAWGSGLVHAHGVRAATWALPALALRPSVVTFHGLHPLRRPAGAAYRALARRWVRLIAATANVVVCVAETERGDAAAAGIPASKIRTIRNAVPRAELVSDFERTAARAALRLDQATFVVVVIARLVEQKDPLTAVRTAEGLDGIVLLAGDGPLRGAVEGAAGRNVRVLGALGDARTAIAAGDVVLSTSLWEGLPLTLLEAMWAGRAIVASDAPGNAEAVGDAGILVPRGDAEGFRAALEKLRDPQERAELAQRARARVEREFDFERMLVETDEVYRDVLATRVAEDPARLPRR